MCCNGSVKGQMCGCNRGKPEKFLEPCVLLLLFEQPTHGYDLIEQLERFGFDTKTQDVGAIYRTLRKLENNGMVASRWEAGGSGPAKRLYEVTGEGKEFLEEWVQSIQFTKSRLENYLKEYDRIISNRKNSGEENMTKSSVVEKIMRRECDGGL